MNKNYKYALKWRLIILFSCSLFIALFFYNAFKFFTENSESILFGLIFWSAFMLLSVYAILMFFFSKLMLTQDRVILRTVFGKRSLMYDEIKEFSSNQYYVYLHPRDNAKKKLEISKYFENYVDWMGFFYENFKKAPSLHEDVEKRYAKSYEETQQVFYSNVAFGSTQEIRDKTIKRGFLTTKTINTIGFILTFYFMFIADFLYEEVALALIALPIFSLFIIKYSNGLIKVFDINEKKIYPTLTSSLWMPQMGLMLRLLLDYNILSYQDIWFYSLLLSVLLAYTAFKLSVENFKLELLEIEDKLNRVEAKISRIILVLFFTGSSFIYSFSSLLMVNCAFDNSEPIKYESIILEKKISTSTKSPDSHYFMVTPWGLFQEKQKIRVNERDYEVKEVGDKVSVYQNQGLLNIPWVYVE